MVKNASQTIEEGLITKKYLIIYEVIKSILGGLALVFIPLYITLGFMNLVYYALSHYVN